MNNFLDPYDLTSGTPPQQSQQSLNEEVSQVMGQLGRFWGDFRKQSQTALETARKDIGGVVTQAQQEFTKLTAETPKSPADSAETTPTESGEESATPRTASPSAQDTPSSSGVQTLFTRLQSALPPNIVSTVQSHIPETLRDASGNIDLAQMRTTLTAEFQRVQGVTLAQAEEYVHKSEALLKEAMKEAGEVFRDAVKVVPPEEAQSSGGSGNLIWDGADMWMLPFDSSDASAKGKEKAGRQSTADTQLAVATRAESLLKRLKHDPEIIKHDPEADAATKEFYGQWLETAMKDGIESEEWTAKIATVLNESADGQGLEANQDALVPAEMTRETFWQRYFFRVYQIEQEEEKRKALLQRSTESEEDFSWEDEDESTPATAVPKSASEQVSSSEPQILSAPPSETPTPATTSPRESSEESYDVVSSDNATAAGKGKKTGESDDGGDSDWE